ncbi:MAG: ribosome silencing factor [Deltaproteobacteria bacterium]|nr:ribosome silencing factor [Deltaproteobacteria bacterium]
MKKSSTDPRETALLCVRFALDKKAYDLLLLEVGAHTSLADYFLICTGRSDTQVQAIAQSIQENLAQLGRRPRTVEGLSGGQWALLDYGDVVVHIFLESVRSFYDLERLWARASVVQLPEPYRSQARDLRLASNAR